MSQNTDAGNSDREHVRWRRNFGSYQPAELRALKFRTIAEFEKAIRLCWDDSFLKGVPRSSPDGKTLIVPAEAVERFRELELEFTEDKVLGPKDFSPEELIEHRRKHAM